MPLRGRNPSSSFATDEPPMNAQLVTHGLGVPATPRAVATTPRAIIALRSCGQNDELRIGKFWHRDPPMGWSGVVRRHHHSPTVAMQPAGQDPEALLAPGMVALPLLSRTNASPFWIMLLLV
jgi:hypothetical protein